ncbi:capsular polysaccharide biosynthesis protein [Caldalkalibacillus uzonensis]|uniref:Capsular polysaccharide biosynthesis protein n=1 Tax=Caldalkalibacillus uzonensis TaxID=353224 RepID=A0ABU0CSP5_9BACI|nr:Wzz/FepE/Etk N-terminal domain-containing protein [Caldalkalibacillus uzonensis]MDQ0339448.1 capsular polysaccharide biosynthesis protein [Caldalkalibacillus uzonensis]
MEKREVQELDLRELFAILSKRLPLIGIITAVAILVSGLVSYFVITPQYEATAEILVNQSRPGSEINQGDIRTNLELMNTYQVVIKSPRILELVIERYNLDKTFNELNEQINVSAVRDSQVMSVSVTDPSPEQAAFIANAVAETFQREIVNLMNVDNVHIMAEAKLPDKPTPVKPKPLLNMAIAGVVGLMTAVGLAFLLEYLDNTIKTEQDVERILGLPVLGTIAHMEEPTAHTARVRHSRKVGGEQIEA